MALLEEDALDFVAHCQENGVGHATVSSSILDGADAQRVVAALSAADVRVACVMHPFANQPDVELDHEAGHRLRRAIDVAQELGSPFIYMTTGGRGTLAWEDAADRFAQLLEPCRAHAERCGVRLLVETASSFNANIHFAHTLSDTIALAEHAGIGVCIDIAACWFEAGLEPLLRRAVPLSGLVQVADYVRGDKSAPARAVPGDGCIPIERILATVLDAGYGGVFDIELKGPRITAEGPFAATARAAQNLSAMLDRLGA